MDRFHNAAARRVLRAAVAPLLILLTPFATFVEYQRYGFSHPDVLIFALVLVALALVLGAGAALGSLFEVVILAFLLTVFADIQLDEPGEKRLLLGFVLLCGVLWILRQHAARIVSLAMGTMLALSFLPTRSQADWTPRGDLPSGNPELPLTIHLILDEHIGIEGLPSDLTPESYSRALQSFFVDHGFRLFGRAYSEYANTEWSLGHLLNLAPGGYVAGLLGPGATDGTFRLTRNAYFRWLAQQGYAIRVHQPEFLDVCVESVRPSACHTYRANSLDALERLPVPAREKLAVVAGAFLGRSELYTRAKRVYRSGRTTLNAYHVALPAWNWERNTSAPLGTMPVWDLLRADAAKARRGDFIYAHLLMPHYPYVYDASCHERPPSQWLTRSDASEAGVPGGITNSSESRAVRYARYLEQIRCTTRMIEGVLNAIPEALKRDAIVILQGDHGSRISLVDPVSTATAAMRTSDHADHFSTLFAVRSARVEAGYDTRAVPITCLLSTLVDSDFQSLGGAGGCAVRRTVYFVDGNTPQPRPLPEFWRREQTPAVARHRVDEEGPSRPAMH